MKMRLFLSGFLLIFLQTNHAVFASESGLYLEPGVGLEGLIEIGKPLTIDKDKIESLQKEYDLQVVAENDGTDSKIVARIKCGKPGCMTDKNISVGVDAAKLLKRYGPPVRTVEEGEVNGDSVIHIYRGVAFKVIKYMKRTKAGEIKKHKIDAIFILPLSVAQE